jgi:putative transposase
MSRAERKAMIDRADRQLPVTRQCELVAISRSSVYYRPAEVDDETLALMRRIDEQYLRTPFYGSRRMAAWLRDQGYAVGRNRVRRLMRRMGLQALYQRPRTSRPAPDHTAWTGPADGPGGVRPRGSASLFRALALNCGNLRRRWQAKGTSSKGEADSSEAPSRGGAARSSVDAAVMEAERRGGVIRRAGRINRATGRNPS